MKFIDRIEWNIKKKIREKVKINNEENRMKKEKIYVKLG